MGHFVPWLILGATAVGAADALQEGNAAASAADYNAEMSRRNAEIERAQASVREDSQRRKARQVLGAQRAAFAQSGGGMGGSALDVMDQSGRDAELDALTLRYEGDLRARGFDAQAKLEKFQGKQAKTASLYRAAGTILSGGAAYGQNKKG